MVYSRFALFHISFIRYFPLFAPISGFKKNEDVYGDDPELSPLVLERACHNDTSPPEQQSSVAKGSDVDWVGGAGGSETSKADVIR